MAKLHSRMKNTCMICEDSGTVILHKTKRQTHALCGECLGMYVSMRMSDLRKQVVNGLAPDFNIRCPGTTHSQLRNQCECPLDLEELALKVSFDTFWSLLCLEHASSSEYTHLCPTSGCDTVIEREKGGEGACPECDITWCTSCRESPFHAGKTCEQFLIEQETTDFGAFLREAYAAGEVKLCPQCRTPTERVRGSDGRFVACNKMTCPNCTVKWCWLCGASGISYVHFNAYSDSSCANKLWENVNTA